jgi:glycosyltransferase involved in cell wall biosynthesis
MKIAYLINQYPKVSHSFIRREILALERQGIEIYRYSVRPCPDILVDESDCLEVTKTYVLLEKGIRGLLLSLISLCWQKPQAFFSTLLLTLKVARLSQRGWLRHFAYLGEACLLWKFLKKVEISHIHAHFGTNPTTVALLCHSLGDITYSFTVHGPEEFDQPVALALTEKINQASFVVAISSYGRSQLYRWCSVSQWSKIQIIHCGLDSEYLEKDLQPIPEVTQLVCVGRLCEQKGQLLLVKAVKEVVESGIPLKLVLVGDGEMRTEIAQFIQEYHLEEQIFITGWANTQQVQEYLLNCRAMVLPSFAEGLPVVIMEALALARPVISTYIAGIPELIISEKSGWLVPAGSLEDLVGAIKTVMALSPQELTQMGQFGREQVKLHHDVNLEAKRLGALFGKVLST